MTEKINFSDTDMLKDLPKPKKPAPLPKGEASPKVVSVPVGCTPRQHYAALAMQVFLEEDLRKPESVQLGATIVAQRAVYMADQLIKELGE